MFRGKSRSSEPWWRWHWTRLRRRKANRTKLPASGSFRGRYDVDSGDTEVAVLNLATPHTEMNASGAIGSRTVQLRVSANTNSLSEFQPLLSAEGQSSIPVEIAGRASFDGTLSGKISHPDIVGRLLATDFSYIYTPAATTAPPPQKRALWRHSCTWVNWQLNPRRRRNREGYTSIRWQAMCNMATTNWRSITA